MELVEVDCPVCESHNFRVVYPDTLGANPPLFGYKWVPKIRRMYRVVRCNSCGHVYCSPRLENMSAYYKGVFDEGYLENEVLRRKTAQKLLPTLLRFKPRGRLLDVGCSTGDFLMVARDHYEVEGLELSEWALKIARKRGHTVHAKKLEDLHDGNGQYDIITMWGVIEHLEYPRKEVRHVNRVLKPGGIFCLWTGDVDSWYAMVFGCWWWYMIGQHLQFFSWKSMDHLMSEAGFKRIYKGIYPYVMSFHYLGISLSRYPVVGSVAMFFFELLGLDNKEIVLKKSDEMFAIYRKDRDAS